MQNLITKEIEDVAKNYPLYSQDGKRGDAVVLARFFTVNGNWTWYLTEYNPVTHEGFGYVLGFDNEMGYIDVDELQKAKNQVFFNGKMVGERQAVERDINVHPGKETLAHLLDVYKQEKPSYWEDK